MTDYWLDVLHKVHNLGLVLSVCGGLIAFAASFFVVCEHAMPINGTFLSKKWLLLWLVPLMGSLLMIFCREIKK